VERYGAPVKPPWTAVPIAAGLCFTSTQEEEVRRVFTPTQLRGTIPSCIRIGERSLTTTPEEEMMALYIEVLGPGCPNCARVEEHVETALEELGGEEPALEATIQHVTDWDEIRSHILATPGLMINHEVVCAGRIPEVDEVKRWLREALAGT
jgi:small redox-active disulfide protein 2